MAIFGEIGMEKILQKYNELYQEFISNIQEIDLKVWYKKYVYGTILVFPILFMGILCIHVYRFPKIIKLFEITILKKVPLKNSDVQDLLDIFIYLIAICLLIVLAGTIFYIGVIKKEDTFYRVFIPLIGIILYSGLDIPSFLKWVKSNQWKNEVTIIIVLVILLGISLIAHRLVNKQIAHWKSMASYSGLYFFITALITVILCLKNNAIFKNISVVIFGIVCLILGICFSIKVNSICFINNIVLIVLADWFTIINYSVKVSKYIWVSSYIFLTVGIVMLFTEWLVSEVSIVFNNDEFSKEVKEILSNSGIIGMLALLTASFFKLLL